MGNSPLESVSFSKTDTYAKCPALFSYKYVRRLQPVYTNMNLFIGIRAHDILAAWYRNQQETGGVTFDPADFVAEFLDQYWDERDISMLLQDELIEQRKEVEAIGQVVTRYLNKGLYDDWQILHVEEEFSITMAPDQQVMTFTPDLVAQDPDGFIWIIDHKTTSSHIDPDAFEVKPQALFYYMGLQEYYPNVVGFRFNYIRKKVPTEPRLNKTGPKKVNNLNRIDTDYDTLYAFCAENGLLDDEDHRARLAELRDHDSFFFEHIKYITDDMIGATLDDLESRIALMHLSVDQELFPRTIQPLNGCKRCDFHSLCFTEMTNGNVDIVMDYYEPREDK